MFEEFFSVYVFFDKECLNQRPNVSLCELMNVCFIKKFKSSK